MKKMISLMCVLLLLATLAINVGAQETATSTTQTPESAEDGSHNALVDANALAFDGTQLGVMKIENVQAIAEVLGENSEAFGTVSIFDKIGQMDSSAFGTISLLSPVADANTSVLNFQYSVLSTNMAVAGFGSQKELDIPEFQAGYTTDLREKFNSVYGDVGSEYQSNLSLPSDLSMTNIMADYTSTRNSLATSFQQSDLYNSTVNSISIGNIFDAAREIKTLPAFQTSADQMRSEMQAFVGNQEAQNDRTLSDFQHENQVDKDAVREDSEDSYNSWTGSMTRYLQNYNTNLYQNYNDLQAWHNEQNDVAFYADCQCGDSCHSEPCRFTLAFNICPECGHGQDRGKWKW